MRLKIWSVYFLGFSRETEPVGCVCLFVCVCVCVCVCIFRERSFKELKIWPLELWTLTSWKSIGLGRKLEMQERMVAEVHARGCLLAKLLLTWGSQSLFCLGLQLTGWGPSTSRRAICFNQSVDLNVNLVQKHPWETFRVMLDHISEHHGPAKLTHKINHHCWSETLMLTELS